jgi:hypothetical protein
MNRSPILKVFQGVADRRQMFRMFDRHAQRPDRGNGDAGSLYTGEWFEMGEGEHDYMLNILPPLWMKAGMFAMREFLTASVTSVIFELRIDGPARYFHAYCDLSDPGSPERMREAIVAREFRPLKAMTRQERLEHIWSETSDAYRSYADENWPQRDRGKRTVAFCLGQGIRESKLLEDLTDAEIAAKLPVHRRYLPEAIAA